MITPLLKTALEPIVARHRLLRLLRALAITLAVCLLTAWLLRGWPAAPMLLMIGFATAAWLINRHVEHWEPDYVAVARGIENQHPELHALLLTAIEQQPDPASGKLHYLQQRVIAHAVRESRQHSWLDAVSARVVWLWGTGAAALFIGFSVLIFSVHRKTAEQPARVAAAEKPRDEAVTVSPGDAEIERGAGMVILATFHREAPSQAALVIERANEPALSQPLMKNLDDPVFGGGVPQVDTAFSYRIEYAGKATRNFTVKVFEHPRLDRADATLVFPDYTKLPDKEVPDTRRISAVEGTKMGVEFQLNKPVASAVLVAKDGAGIPLEVKADAAVVALRDFTIAKSAIYELKLTDSDGRANKMPATFIVDALPNREPELKFVTPRGDQQATPIEEIAFRAEAWDDFGLGRYGLVINLSGQGEKEIELGKDAGRDERREFTHLLKLEELGMKPDELISWYLWAEDTGADGQPRRTASDMFFAEVKPFDEIFRAGDGSEGGQQQQSGGGQGGEAEQRANQQKQVIIASWNLQRAEQKTVEPKPSAKYREDLPVIRDAQAESLAKTKEIAEKLEDPKSAAFAETAVTEMQAALDLFIKSEKEPDTLPEAVDGAQSAYNALLKLSAHEYRVSRQNNSRGQQGGQGERNQQQLDNLELKEDEKRYETKREAEPMQNEQQREQLAVLNRLKELAQRQGDINERLKELQTALEEAKTEEAKEEVRRQLARLREEEQQMLADIDEAKQRMEESAQQAQFADERRQLDQTREEAQKAAEAIERKETTQALASGTRAAEQLEKMKEDFRKKTSGQFNEEMREMRTEAREVAQKQEEISEKLNAKDEKPQRRTLDGSGEKEELAKALGEQRDRLGALTDEMKRVSEQAEVAEPLLARELYDTLRKASQAATSETLEQTKMLAERGYDEQARTFEAKARGGIDELKEGVERAAESVLGDEAEGIRQARAELDALSEQIDREIARARPELAQADSNSAPSNQAGKAPDGQPAEAAAGQDGSPSNPPKDEETQAQNGGQPGAEPGAGTGRQDEQGKPASQAGQGSQSQGEQPGEQGQQPGQGQQAGVQGQRPGRGVEGRQQGEGEGEGKSGGSAGGGEGEGGRENAEQPSDQNAEEKGGSRIAQMTRSLQNQRGGRGGGGGGGGGGGPEDEAAGPLTGENYSEWADRLRNVEEMVDSPEIRAEAARIRERAKAMRADFKRHSIAPKWDMVQTQISQPLAELRARLGEELARRESKENLVPIDRDPVPSQYADRVRRYYEDLGQSR